MKWVAGSDHAGLVLKRALVAKLEALGDEVVDIGTHDDCLGRLSHVRRRGRAPGRRRRG